MGEKHAIILEGDEQTFDLLKYYLTWFKILVCILMAVDYDHITLKHQFAYNHQS